MRFISTGHPRWKLRPDRKFAVRLASLSGHRGQIAVYDGSARELACLIGDQLTIRSSYQFDGCTLAPDCPRALRGCCVHDALLQLLAQHPGAYSRQAAHDAMLEIQTRDRFLLRRVYHLAVRLWPFRIKHNRKRSL